MKGRINKSLIALTFFIFLPQPLLAESLWSDVPDVDGSPAAASAVSISAAQPDPHKNSRRVSVSFDQLKAALANAETLPPGQQAKSSLLMQLDLPMPDGGLQTFNVYESSVMAAELAARYPQIKTYKAIAESDAGIRGVLNLGPNGFRGYLFTPDGEVFIDPVPNSDQQYYSYYKHNYVSTGSREFSCGVSSQSETQSPVEEFKNADLVTAARTSSGDKISYRIAVAATGEYSQKVGGGDVSSTLAEINTAISRLNEIFERDLAIRLELVADNNLIIYTNASTDPYTDPGNASLLLEENQTNLDKVLGSPAYDIGHVLSTQGGGLAGLGVACRDAYKARGESGLSNPTGDPFYIDILAHEIGHQLGANHSFNGTTESCAVNRNAATAFEPGSGSTIMAYAGICGAEDIAQFSDAVFHAGSIAEIITYTRTGFGAGCGSDDGGSPAPVTNAGEDYIIPGGTAFALAGSVLAPALSYQWDQMDAGSATTAITIGTDIGSNALFRSFEPQVIPVRTFPRMATLLSNVTDKAEILPTENRTLHFRFTARDGNGGVDEDDMQIIVNGDTGPFEILQPNTNVILDSAQLQSIQWNAACTETGTVNCANVDIFYSSDNGATFTTLLAGTPNDGIEEVNFANAVAENARIKVACSDNIFFDISDVNFELRSGNGIALPTDEIGGSYDCGTATGIVGENDIEPNNFPAQAQTLHFPSVLNGTVNNVQDPEDYFAFVAEAVGYTFTLSNDDGYDLDLYLLDSTAQTVIASSQSAISPVESINIELIMGRTYYLVVVGFNTASQDSSYTLSAQSQITKPGGGGALSLYALLLLLTTPLLRRQQAW